MSFLLDTFESHISADILGRGLDYFAQGLIGNLAETDGSWVADVHETSTYTVEAEIEDGLVVDYHCDCPYDWGPICKHIVALLFAIREETTKEAVAPKTNIGSRKKRPLKKVAAKQAVDPLEEIISKLNPQETRKILLFLAKRYDGVRTHLLTKYTHLISTNTRPQIKELVKSIIASHVSDRHGYIDYTSTNRLGEAIYQMLMESQSEDPMGQVDLCEEVIQQLGDAYPGADDSNGSLGMAIDAAFEILADTVKSEETPPEVTHYIFKMALKEIGNKHLENYGIEGFQSLAVIATHSQAQAEQLIEVLDDYIAKKEQEEYGQYGVESAVLNKYQLINEWYSPHAANAYLHKNLHIRAFRQMAIENAFADQRYDEVRKLAEAGIAQHKKDAPGYVRVWEGWLVKVAETTNDTDTLIFLTEQQFLSSGDIELYRKLKKLIPAKVFADKPDQYIAHFSDQKNRFGYHFHFFNQKVANILQEEKRYSDLVKLIEKKPSLPILEQYFKLLGQDYKDTFFKLYDQLIRKDLERASSRSHYRDCCSYLSKLKRFGGEKTAQKIASDLKTIYARRPALLDELRKAGF